MKFAVFSADGSSQREADFAGVPTFEGEKGLQAVKEVVVAQAANARLGTHSTLRRGEVRGGGKKPWNQKGTGRARQGSTRSPLWVGGGVVFGPKPRDYSKKVNKKVKDLAFRRSFFDRAAAGDVVVIESLSFASGKTKEAAALIAKLAPAGSVLVLDTAYAATAQRALRNLARVTLSEAAVVNPTDLCRYDKYIVTEAAMKALLARLGGEA